MANRRLLFLIFVYSAVTFIACKTAKLPPSKKYTILLTNPSSIERADELIVLTREMIELKTGAIGENKFVIISDKNNVTIPLQFDDMNMDGRWDEAVFLYKFEPNERVTLNIAETNMPPEKSTVRAHVRVRKKNDGNTFGTVLDSVTIPAGTLPTDFSKQKLPLYLTEGPAWENDKVAFRLYLDNRNTKDIYGKTTPHMMMDTVGANPAENYHQLAAWGMDILASGKSLGAGSLALKIPLSSGKDTLVRLGGNNIGSTTYKKIADGPVRAVFVMQYKNWVAVDGMSPLDVTEQISIWGGKFFYESQVTISNAPAGTQFVTGVVNLKSKKLNKLDVDEAKIVYTYDTQSENKDKLGLGIMIRNDQFGDIGKAPDSKSDVINTYTVAMPLATRPLVFRFYSGWERSDLLFAHEESFKQFLVNEGKKFTKPVIAN